MHYEDPGYTTAVLATIHGEQSINFDADRVSTYEHVASRINALFKSSIDQMDVADYYGVARWSPNGGGLFAGEPQRTASRRWTTFFR